MHRAGRDVVPGRLDSFLYGSGLCFGMAVAALTEYGEGSTEPPLSGLPLTQDLLASLRERHARQLRPRAVLAAVHDWVVSGGGRPAGVLQRVRLGGDPDPHVLCFGPALNRRFLRCLYRAHAVAPYRIDRGDGGARLYVYDPNHPGDRERSVLFRGDGFCYGRFSSREGWGITLVPLSAVGEPR